MKNVMIMKALQKPIITWVVLLFLYVHHHGRLASAASGGRMGGTSFSSSSTSPRSRSRTSTSFYSTSYNSIPRSSYSRCYSTQICSPVQPVFAVKFGPLDYCIIITTVFAIYFLLTRYAASQDPAKTSLLKLQVGLLGRTRSLQKDLNQIAKTADTSTPKGFRNILQETTLSVLQHPDYCISGYSSVEVKMGVEECEKQFNKLSTQERGKFDEETLVNFNNFRKQSGTTHEEASDGACNEYIVVTIIVAASGVHELPPIKSNELLKIVLLKLASIPSNNIMAVEVLWTPQKENDSLTEKQMLDDYPLLCPL